MIMAMPVMKKLLEKQHFRFVGEHTAIKICHWTKESLRERNSCYKQKFYGIQSHRCIQISPSVGYCQNNCIYCWREIQYSLKNTYEEYKAIDEPSDIVDQAILAQRNLLTGFGGNPNTKPEKFKEAQEPLHFAVSLSGEPTMYPKIGELIEEINRRGHSSFLVTNGMLPDRLESMEAKGQLPTQLYLSLNATDKEMFDLIEHPLYPDAWERLHRSMAVVKRLREKKRTRTVVRITCIKGYNMEDAAAWARMLVACNPQYLEVKGYTFVGSSRNRMLLQNSPRHEDVREFSDRIVSCSDYKFIDDKEVSRVVLLAQEDWPDRIMEF